MLLHQFSPHAAAGFELVANADTPQPNVRGIIMSFKAPDVPHEQQCAKGLIGYETTKSQT